MAGRGARSPPPGPAPSASRRRRHPPGESRLLQLRRARASPRRRRRLRRPGAGARGGGRGEAGARLAEPRGGASRRGRSSLARAPHRLWARRAPSPRPPARPGPPSPAAAAARGAGGRRLVLRRGPRRADSWARGRSGGSSVRPPHQAGRGALRAGAGSPLQRGPGVGIAGRLGGDGNKAGPFRPGPATLRTGVPDGGGENASIAWPSCGAWDRGTAAARTPLAPSLARAALREGPGLLEESLICPGQTKWAFPLHLYQIYLEYESSVKSILFLFAPFGREWNWVSPSGTAHPAIPGLSPPSLRRYCGLDRCWAAVKNLTSWGSRSYQRRLWERGTGLSSFHHSVM